MKVSEPSNPAGEELAASTARVIDGKAISATIRKELSARVATLKETYHRVPGLAVVIVGSRVDSRTYVNSKRKACEEVGIISFDADLPEDVSQEELLAVVQRFNANPDVHGILIQLPLPEHLNERDILGAVSVEKDVDGFHPLNVGQLCMKGREPLFAPCTPLGCMALLERSNIPIKGKRAVVVGRSNTVGMPAAMLLTKRDATVTICHSGTKLEDMERIVHEADIVIAAVGRAQMIKASWIKPGATVIDVGINPQKDPSKKLGYRLVGDVDYEGCRCVAGAITPVPGGVGPMTIAMLLLNTVDSGERHMASGVGSTKQHGDAMVAAVAAGDPCAVVRLQRRTESWAGVALGTLVASLVMQRLSNWVLRRSTQ